MHRRYSAVVFGSIVAGSLAMSGGCGGGGGGNEQIVDSPEAKKATTSHIDAMREAMQAKGKAGKPAAKPAAKP